MLRIKNKKADVSVVLFVLFTLVICVLAIYAFITSSNQMEFQISDFNRIEEVYLKFSSAKFYLNLAGKEAFFKTYKEVVNQELYVEQPVKKVNSNLKFENLNSNWKQEFNNKFKENFKLEFSSYSFNEDYLINLRQLILDNEFEILEKKGGFDIFISNLNLSSYSKTLNVTYTPKFLLGFDFNKEKLNSFEEIYEIKEICKSQKGVEVCFNENLLNFNAELIEKEKTSGEKYFVVNLESKKSFLFESGFEKIKLSFVLV